MSDERDWSVYRRWAERPKDGRWIVLVPARDRPIPDADCVDFVQYEANEHGAGWNSLTDYVLDDTDADEARFVWFEIPYAVVQEMAKQPPPPPPSPSPRPWSPDERVNQILAETKAPS